MALKHLVFALAVAAACAVAPFPRGSTEAVGDTFEMGKAVAENDATLAVDMTPKLRGGAEGHRPAGRGLDFGQYQTGKPTAAPTAEPTSAEPVPVPTAAPTTDPCGDLVPIAVDECPLKGIVLATCDVVACGELCEGDGECGTNIFLNNCDRFSDVYRKYCAATPAPAVTLAPTGPVGGPAAAACLALEDGTCEKCCGGCIRATPTIDCRIGTPECVDFSGLDECVCFEGEVSGESFYYDYADNGIDFENVVLTSKNDCAKVDGDYVKIYARARRQSTRTSRFLADGGVPRRAGGATTRLLSTATSTNSGFAPASALPAALDLGFYRRATRATTCCTLPATATGFTCAPRPPSPGTALDLVSFRRAAAALTR